MKRIAKALVIVTLASAAAAATAAQPQFPSSGQDQYPLSQVVPNIDTYKREHRDSVATQATVPGPATAQDEYPLSSEFPGMVTYRQSHRNDTVAASRDSAFPYSVDPEPSMAEEGLVPGIAGVAPYAAPAPDTAVGATR